MKFRVSKLRQLFAVLLVGGPLLGACSDIAEEGPSGPRRSESLSALYDTSSYYPVYKTGSDRLALNLEGFGGAFLADGYFNVYLTESHTQERITDATRVLQSVFDSIGRTLPEVKFISASYTFKQLRAWEYRISKSWMTFGIVSTGVDEKTNTLRIGVSDIGRRAEMLETYSQAGIPSQALTVVEAKPLPEQSDLDDRRRPVIPGIKIQVRYGPSSGSLKTCTLGPTFEMWNATVFVKRLSLTNSHCVQNGGLGGWEDNQEVFQPQELWGTIDQFATIRSNPAPTTTLPGCPSGYVCRYSDAAVMTVENPLTQSLQGYIPRTTSRGFGPGVAGSVVLGAVDSLWELKEYVDNYYVGDTLEKVGFVSGWTAGLVTQTCQTEYVSGFAGAKLCQGRFAAYSAGGDSGSPVVLKIGNDRHPVGMLWGGNGSEIGYSRLDGMYVDVMMYLGIGRMCFKPHASC